MKKIFTAFLIVCSSYIAIAQNEASFWYFGQNAGLQFNAETGTVTAITNGQLSTLEGCTSISDTDGNLLFYSDGRTVWNRAHEVMLNGTGLKGDESSTSSGLIVPKPQDPNFYYLFSVDEPHHFNSSAFPGDTDGDGVNDGLTYSRINILDNGGLGAVDNDEKNIPLITYDTSIPLHEEFKCSEKITAVRADDCSSFWVITHFADTFYAFKVDTDGVSSTAVTSTVGPNVPVQGYRRNALGYLKASPDGTKLVVAHFGEASVLSEDAGGGVYLFDFDNDTGTVSNSMELYSAANNDSPYGVEFSAENRKVYATVGLGINGNGASQVLQWDLESDDIPGSMQVIHTSSSISAGALQLGIDRRIYRAQLNFANVANTGRFIGVINNPEANGPATDYDEQGVLLDINGGNQNLSRIGLPPFIQSLFNSQIDIIRNGISTTELRLCTGESYTLTSEDIPGADYVWSFNGTPLAEDSFELLVDTPGFYEVFIEPNNGECPIEGSAVVGIFDIPIANPLTDVTACDDNSDGIFTFDFTSKDIEALDTQNALQFDVKYFETLEDAENNVDEITFPYQNSDNPQEIFVRVENFQNSNCYDINSFMLEVFESPVITASPDLTFCDNEGDITDGVASIDLNILKDNITLDNEDETIFTTTYHLTQADASNNANPLPNVYTNTSSPFNQEIFIRIENDNYPDCFRISNSIITINAAPQANDVTIIQCDEDGIPEGFTTFNINQIVDDITGGEANRNVQYYLSAQDAQDDVDEINGEAFNNFFNPQIIYTRVTDTQAGCTNFSQISLTISNTSSNDTALSTCDDDGTEDGFHVFNLNDASNAVLAGLPDGLDLEFYETYDEALTETNPLSANYTNTIPYNQTIYARVENANACFGISEIQLTVFELPNIETAFETLYCLNDFPELITLDGGVINDTPNNFFYQWSTGATTMQIQVNQPGTYSVRVTNTDGCFKDRTITVLPSNVATITDVQVIDASQNNSIAVFVSGEGDYEYALDNSNGPYQDDNNFDNLQPGLYTVYVRDKNNCGITEELVSVLGFPKFFTPNGDADNNFWQIKGIISELQTSTPVLIFDRYGKLLVELNPLSQGWDGTYNGALMPASDYWFTVTLADGRTFTSHFALKR